MNSYLMQNLLVSTIFLVVFAGLALADEINFQDCGQNEVLRLDLWRCDRRSVECALTRGRYFRFSGDLLANQNTQTAQIHLSLVSVAPNSGSVSFAFPGVEVDACNGHLACPLARGQRYSFNYELTVPKFLPTGAFRLYAQLVGDQGVLACVTIAQRVL